MNRERKIIFAGLLFLNTGLLGCRSQEDRTSLDYNAYNYPLMNAGALERKRAEMLKDLCLEETPANGSDKFRLKRVKDPDLYQVCQNALSQGDLSGYLTLS